MTRLWLCLCCLAAWPAGGRSASEAPPPGRSRCGERPEGWPGGGRGPDSPPEEPRGLTRLALPRSSPCAAWAGGLWGGQATPPPPLPSLIPQPTGIPLSACGGRRRVRAKGVPGWFRGAAPPPRPGSLGPFGGKESSWFCSGRLSGLRDAAAAAALGGGGEIPPKPQPPPSVRFAYLEKWAAPALPLLPLPHLFALAWRPEAKREGQTFLCWLWKPNCWARGLRSPLFVSPAPKGAGSCSDAFLGLKGQRDPRVAEGHPAVLQREQWGGRLTGWGTFQKRSGLGLRLWRMEESEPPPPAASASPAS